MPRFQYLRPFRGTILLMPFIVCYPSKAATSETQAWTTAHVSAAADNVTNISVDIGHRFRRSGSDNEQWIGRLAIDRSIADGVQVGGGIAYLEGEEEEEMRLFQQITFTQGIWSARTRIEERFFDAASTASWRLRQKIQATIPIDSGKKWSIILANETMANLNQARPNDKKGIATMRNQIGFRHRLTEKLDAQLLYMHQRQFRSHRPDGIAHIPWLTLSWRI